MRGPHPCMRLWHLTFKACSVAIRHNALRISNLIIDTEGASKYAWKPSNKLRVSLIEHALGNATTEKSLKVLTRMRECKVQQPTIIIFLPSALFACIVSPFILSAHVMHDATSSASNWTPHCWFQSLQSCLLWCLLLCWDCTHYEKRSGVVCRAISLHAIATTDQMGFERVWPQTQRQNYVL